VRSALRREYLKFVLRGFPKRTNILPGHDAIVFAPHQDDETLGCGGTILKKRQNRVPVRIVFMADGASKNPWFSPAEMRAMRLDEAKAAACALGVADDHVTFLDFPEGELRNHRPDATVAVQRILETEQPSEIFIPFWRDTNADHVATNEIVWEGARKSGLPLTIYEYPIWFWQHWPLTAPPLGASLKRNLAVIRHGVICASLVSQFNAEAFVGDVLHDKRRALAKHVSQTVQLVSDMRWSTLHDVAEGEWLDVMFQNYEIFRRKSLGIASQRRHLKT
jgi:LmbE family N-acetylglucosaminyl deacetylase